MRATFTVANDGQLNLLGTINNTWIPFGDAPPATTPYPEPQGNVTLTGAGSITLSTTGNGTAIINQGGASTLTTSTTSFKAKGTGNNGLTVVNQAAGVIDANLAGVLVINPNTSLNAGNPFGLSNQGLLEANGGTLQFSGSTIDNAGGSISAIGGTSAVQLINNVIFQGGTLSTSGGATLGIPGDFFATLDGSTQGPVANTGTFTIANDGQLNILGTINNTGSIQVSAAGNNTVPKSGGRDLGTGTVKLSTSGNGTAFINQNGVSTLTNSGNTILDIGQINVASYVQTSGLTQILAGSSASLTTLAVNGGNVQVDGSLAKASSGASTSDAGVISGTGSIPANLSDSGITEGGNVPAAGVLTISNSGTYAQTTAGDAYEVAIGGLTAGTQYCKLNVSGSRGSVRAR